MRRYFVSLLVLTVVLSCLVACGGQTPAETTAAATSGTTAVETSSDTTADTTAAETASAADGAIDVSAWSDDGYLKILTIGNSFSDDSMEYVYKIAESAGIENIVLGNLVIGGCSIDTHYANATGDLAAYIYRHNDTGEWVSRTEVTIGEILEADNWDYVSIQQVSNYSGRASSYDNLEGLIGYLKEHIAENTKIVWNMTWAYQQDSTHSGFSYYRNDQLRMFTYIINVLRNKILPNEDIFLVIPTGTAIQNARTSYLGDTITRDGYHLSFDIGRYIAGMAFVRTLTGLPVDGVTYLPAGLDDSIRLIAIESATNAAQLPLEVTRSQYTEAPVIDLSGYELIEIELTPFAYWVSTDSASHHTLITEASNSPCFYASELLTREDIPVGSIIAVENGWQYRPEAWKDDGAQSSRPSTVSSSFILVTEEWWGEYTHRAFNISKTSGESLVGFEDEAANALKIYVPKK